MIMAHNIHADALDYARLGAGAVGLLHQSQRHWHDVSRLALVGGVTGGPFPLRVVARRRVHHFRRLVLLVPEDDRLQYSKSLGKLHFWLMFMGANIAFFLCTSWG